MNMRVRIFLVHLSISAICALLVAFLVFKVWYPAPYYHMAGGFSLFGIIMLIDVICGPFLTLLVSNPKKTKRHLAMDLSTIALIQLCALGYGIHSVFLARPIAEVFEVDRMVVVSAAQIDPTTLIQAPVAYRKMSITGKIHFLAVRDAHSPQENLESMMFSIQGVEPSARPDWWMPFVDRQEVIKNAIKPVSHLLSLQTEQNKNILLQSLKKAGLTEETGYYLPLVSFSEKSGWIRLFNANGDIKGYAPIDGFQ